jgi:hypothetical protein
VANYETLLRGLILSVTVLADGAEVTWAIDLKHGGAALMITLLVTAEQRLPYILGRTIYRASGGYRGDGKTDAKGAAMIADERGCTAICSPCDLVTRSRWTCASSPLAVATWWQIEPERSTRCVALLKCSLPWSGPSSTRTAMPPSILLTGYQTPDGLRRTSAARVAAWLRKRKACNASAVATTATAAANRQQAAVPGQ